MSGVYLVLADGTTHLMHRMCTTTGLMVLNDPRRTNRCIPLACVVKETVGVHYERSSSRFPDSWSEPVPMSEETNIALLQKIVEDQRTILRTVHGVDDVTTIPQMWTLCMYDLPVNCHLV